MAAEQALQLGLQRDDEVVVVAVLLDERVVGVIRSGIAVEAFDGVPDGVELFAVFNAGLECGSVLDESVAGFSQQHLAAPGIGFALGAEAGLLGFEFLERGLQRRAVAEFLTLDGIIKLVARGENSLERKILPLRKGIVFVVVTAGAGQGQSEECGARGVDQSVF